MSTDTITDLLHEVADAVEPGDRLDAIRVATAGSGRRTPSRGWWVTGGIGLVAASAVTALALSTGGTLREADPASPAPTTASTLATEAPRTTYGPVDVFFLADTTRGPRLHRELETVDGNDVEDRLATAVGFALGRAQDGSPRPPLDPDYRVAWPAGTTATASLDRQSGEIDVSIGGDPEDGLRSRGRLSEDEAELAIEALVRTAQSAVGDPLPVRFELFGEPVDSLLGVPTAEPLAARPDADVLSGVSLVEPSDGLEVREGEALWASGFGLSEGDVVLRVERDGVAVLTAPFDVTAEEGELPSFGVHWGTAVLTPGDYVLVASMTHPDGTLDTDTRRFTVVEQDTP